MKDFSDVILGSVGDTPLTLNDLLFQLKTNLEQHIVDDAVHNILLRKAAAEMDITVSDEELQEAADNFRKDMNLISANETNEWLEEHGLTIEDFEKKIENDLFKSKVEANLATDDKINKMFAESILDFEKASIAQIVVNDKGLADEIKTQLDEEEADFATLAGKYSSHKESAVKGGVLGLVNRDDLPDEVDVVVFGEDTPGLFGPIEARGSYYIIKIVEPKKADPNDEVTKSTCVKVIFDEYMEEMAQTIAVDLDFLSK